jgi:ATP-binding cassette subfamily C (CFTR/MRP) protein 4
VSIDNDFNPNLKNRTILGRGPVVSHLASSLQGLTSVKAFNAQKILVGEFDQHQDRHSSALYLLLACHATIRFWVDMTCAIYIAVVTFSSFLVEGSCVGFSYGL